MKLNKGYIYYPNNRNINRVKYLCFCAHQDDAEIMAIHGILKGYYSKKYSFSLVVTTDGSGSARCGEFKDVSDEEMKDIRLKEQKEASELGRYNSVYFLNYTSKEVKEDNEQVINDYIEIIKELRPEVIYTHSILDKHKTHVAVALKLIEALKRLPKEYQPKVLYGCEVWRSFDWIKDEKKIGLDVSRNLRLQKKLLSAHKSQVAGGKDYVNATIGRRYQNATFYKSHSVDRCKLASFAIDMKPLLNKNISIKEFAISFVKDLEEEVLSNL